MFCVLLAATACRAVPARSLYVPPVREAPRSNSLAESSWRCKLFSGECFITFHANGTLTYRDQLNGPPTKGEWKADGDRLYFHINHYSEYQTVIQGDTIEGTGTNKAGNSCQARLTRMRE
jgi:hypothetical protein